MSSVFFSASTANAINASNRIYAILTKGQKEQLN